MKKKLNIVIFAGIDDPVKTSGGLIYDMYKSLSLAGHSVVMGTKCNDDNQEGNLFLEPDKKNLSFIIQKLKFKLSNFSTKQNGQYYMFGIHETDAYLPTKKILSKIPFKVDLIMNIHPHFFLNARNLYELSKQTGAPVFNIPVDMAVFTGGCHYANDCRRYEAECGCCPGLFSRKMKDASYRTLKYKKKYISKTDVYLLANEWTLRHAKQSSLYSDKPCFNLNMVINETLFIQGDKMAMRVKYNIPQDKSVILFGATFANEKRKGIAYLQEALKKLYREMPEAEKKNIAVIVIGHLQEDIKDSIPFETYLLGHVHPKLLPEIYQTADVYVSPSIQDAGPMMVIQSMMCGTPVVAFEMGNAEDFIVNGETGYMAQLHDAEQLKDGIRLFLNKTTEEKQQISDKCRSRAMAKSSYAVFSARIAEIYRKTTLH
jgi:glycosyltransferase involved in cell wall biosynthesis